MARPRFRDSTPPSRLEARFLNLWSEVGGPPLETECRFHPHRRRRADFVHLPSRGLIEIEGGIWILGRHHRAAGFNADLEKVLEAGLLGWRVFRLGPDQLTFPLVVRLAAIITHTSGTSAPVEPPVS